MKKNILLTFVFLAFLVSNRHADEDEQFNTVMNAKKALIEIVFEIGGSDAMSHKTSEKV